MAATMIVIVRNGPYRVEGGVRLLRTAIVETERGEPIEWEEGPDFAVSKSYELCRCGESAEKPFCDRVCERISFDGAETADRRPIAARRSSWEGSGLVLYDDGSLCTQAGFCKNRQTDVWVLADDADDEGARAQFVTMVHHCPSGRLAYAESVDPGTAVEPVFEASIGVEPNASYWVRGGIPVVAETVRRTRCATDRRSAGAGTRRTSRSATAATSRRDSPIPRGRADRARSYLGGGGLLSWL